MLTLFFLAGLGGVLDDHQDSYYGPDSGFALGSRIFYGVMAAASLFVGIRWFRMGIFVTPTQVVVRNVFSTARLSWSEITGFGKPPPYGALRKAGLLIRLRDGTTVSATLFGSGMFNRATFADALIADLHELQEQYGPRPAAGQLDAD